MKDIIADSDFDGPLVNYAAKGNKVEYARTEPVEGTDAFKLKVTLADGEVRFYYMDTDYYVPIKVETKRMIRGAEREFETSLGDYKEVGGVYFPWSIESGPKGSPQKGKVTYDKITANDNIADSRFIEPVASTKPPAPCGEEVKGRMKKNMTMKQTLLLATNRFDDKRGKQSCTCLSIL